MNNAERIDSLRTYARSVHESDEQFLLDCADALEAQDKRIAELESELVEEQKRNTILKLAIGHNCSESGVKNLILQSQEHDRRCSNYMTEINNLRATRRRHRTGGKGGAVIR